MYKADLNPIELLIWSRNRSLQEVQKKIYEIKSETSSSLKKSANRTMAYNSEKIKIWQLIKVRT